MSDARIILGAMSGTSADGVDVAVMRVSGTGLSMSATLLHHHHRPYDLMTRRMILALRKDGTASLAEWSRLGREISLTYAAACNEALFAARLTAEDIAGVAAHGQTLFHDPPLTLQWLDPSLLAAEVGCPVVSDFRRADCAAGGQGAPLVPFADYLLFRNSDQSRVLVNIGGIANLTYLRAGGSPEEIIAFDTGPGNCISDAIMRRRADAPYDADGLIALDGAPDETLVRRLIQRDYFLTEPPRTTDVPSMLALYQAVRDEVVGDHELTLADELATACLITARSIIQAAFTMDFVPKYPAEIIVSGGGTRNRAIMTAMRSELARLKMIDGPLNFSDASIRTTDELGVPSQTKEAIAFGLLGAATLDGFPGNFPSATGARRAVVLGSVTPRPH